jgi:hypothetical protein
LWSGQRKPYENKNSKMTTHLTRKTKKGAYTLHIYMKITDTRVLEAKKAPSCRLIMGGVQCLPVADVWMIANGDGKAASEAPTDGRYSISNQSILSPVDLLIEKDQALPCKAYLSQSGNMAKGCFD